jgi:hypothetical protein
MFKNIALGFLFFGAGTCMAGTLLFSGTPPTLGSGLTDTGGLPIFACCALGFRAAVGFSVAAGTSYTLDDISVVLRSDGNAASPLTALLYQDVGGNPGGAPVADLSRVICPCGNGEEFSYTLTPSSAFTLNPSTTYWLVLSAVPANSRNIQWKATQDANPYSGVLTYAGSRQGSGVSIPTDPTIQKLIFAVDGSAQNSAAATPEPQSAMLIGFGIIAISGIATRRRLRQSRFL